VAGGLEQHLLEPGAAGRLRVGLLGDGHPRSLKALGQVIADPLEISEAENPRFRSGPGTGNGDPVHAVGERGHEGIRQLALELGDLTLE